MAWTKLLTMNGGQMFTRILAIAVDAVLGVAGLALGIAVGAILGVAGVASGNGDKPTKFTIRVENITKAEAFTASNDVKWSLAFSPGAAIVHTDKAPIFLARQSRNRKEWEYLAQSPQRSPS
jgi:hypothetical protein